MARTGWKGKIIKVGGRPGERTELKIQWTEHGTDNMFFDWIYPDTEGVFWRNGYPLYVDYQQVTESEVV